MSKQLELVLLSNYDCKFYQVGGSVRDELLGVKSKDLDYTVVAPSYESMKGAILDRGGQIFLETPEFFTIRAKVPNLGACDYVLARKDGAYSNGRSPDTVSVGTLEDDLRRRDFTFNALAKDEDGTILDLFGGKDDLLKHRVVRCVGNAEERFNEDKLRILRALRFSIKYHLSLDEEIHNYLTGDNIAEQILQSVSIERVREELFKCFKLNTFETLAILMDYGLDEIFHLSKLWLKPTLEE